MSRLLHFWSRDMPIVSELVRLSAAQLAAGGGQQDIDYMLDRPPYTRYWWTGDSFEALGTGFFDTVADEAAMIALSSATAGSEVYRTDTSTFWKLRVDPYSSAANWIDLGNAASGSGFYELATDAAIIAAASGASLTGTPCIYVATDTGNTYSCPSASEAYFLAYGSQQASYRGEVTTVAALVAIANPYQGDQALLDISGLPHPITCFYDGTAWRSRTSLRIDVCNRAAGTTSATEQGSASWTTTIPAGLFRLFRTMQATIYATKWQTPYSLVGTTNIMSNVWVTCGTDSTATQNTKIFTHNGDFMTAATTSRPTVCIWRLNPDGDAQPANEIQSVFNNAAGGIFAGGSSTYTDSFTKHVPTGSVAGAGDFDDVLYVGVTVDLDGTTDTPSISLLLDLNP